MVISTVRANELQEMDILGSIAERMPAPSCVSNSTHCNCAKYTSEAPKFCYKPALEKTGFCTKNLCIGGSSESYQCDCTSSRMCTKEKRTHYVPIDPSNDGNEVECAATEKTVLRPFALEESCIANSTHCNCAFAPPPKDGSTCLRPIPGVPGKCFIDSCGRGLQCDCASNTLCILENSWYYKAVGTAIDGVVDCTRLVKKVPVLYVP